MGVEGNRVYVRTATVGTGTITLGAAFSAAFTTFAESGITDGTVVRSYCIEDGTDFEIGSGTYTSAGTTLSRTTVFLSKIGGTSGTTKITLSGNATVSVIAAQEDIVKTTGDNSLDGDLTWTGAAWTAFSPTLSAGSGTFTSASAAGVYKQLGKVVFLSITVTITTVGTAAGAVNVNVPLHPTASASSAIFAGRENASTGLLLQGALISGSGTISILKYDNTSPIAAGASLIISGSYETA